MNSIRDSAFIDTNILLYAYDRDAGVKVPSGLCPDGERFYRTLVRVEGLQALKNGLKLQSGYLSKAWWKRTEPSEPRF